MSIPRALPPQAFKGIIWDVQGVVNHTLTKDPANRFQTAEDLAAVIRSAKDPAWRWLHLRSTGALKIGQFASEPPATSSFPWNGTANL